MNSRERVRRAIAREPVDRIPIFDSFWTETEKDFRQHGIPEDVSLGQFFDFDIELFWFEQSFLLERKVFEETDEYRIESDDWGTVNRVFKEQQTTPGLIEFGVKDRASWETEFKPLQVMTPERLELDRLRKHYTGIRKREKYAVLSMLGPFECTWHRIGPEKQLVMLVEDPDWLMDMYATDVQLIKDGWKALWEAGVQPDALWLFEDIAYRSGMLFSPRHYKKVLQPFHAQLTEFIHSYGCQVIYHSDGDLAKALPLLVEAGIDCLQPMEVKAGMDVRKLKEEYGDKLAFMGNIDARLFQENDLAGLEAELRAKLPVAMNSSGYIYHSDHSIPPGARLETYQFCMDLVKELGNYD